MQAIQHNKVALLLAAPPSRAGRRRKFVLLTTICCKVVSDGRMSTTMTRAPRDVSGGRTIRDHMRWLALLFNVTGSVTLNCRQRL